MTCSTCVALRRSLTGTAGPYDADVDEMALANLTPVPSELVRPY